VSLQSAWQKSFTFLGSKPVVVEPVEEHLTSDAGLLPIRQFDEQIGFTAEFAAALRDTRHAPFVDHCFAEMSRSRIYGILAGYADQNDHDQLRYDPVFKLLAGRRPRRSLVPSESLQHEARRRNASQARRLMSRICRYTSSRIASPWSMAGTGRPA
jgi:Transposase DDE domain group 1